VSELYLKTSRGMLWSLIQNIGLQVIQFLISILLARLLLPAEFGLIGMLTIFIVMAQLLLDGGFGLALIQKKNASQIDNCSILYFNLLVGVVLAGMICIAAPLIATFFKQPVLIPLTRFLSLIIILNAFYLVPSALLKKRMEFKILLLISLISVVISGGVGIVLALEGVGVWSLAVQSVLNSLISAILTWRASKWRPSWIYSSESLKSMFSFGSRMLVTQILEAIFQNIYQPLIGKLYSIADVGYYTRAQSMKSVAISPASSALWNVMVPALSSIQDDPARLRQAVQKTMIYALFFQFPLMIGLIIVAHPLITLLLTDRWATSIIYFQLFCIVGLFYPFQVLNLNILVVVGRSDLYLRLDIIRRILVILALIITYRYGILALIYGQVVTSFFSDFLMNSYYSKRLIGYSLAQQILDAYPFFLMSLGMGASMYLIGPIISPLLPRLLAQFFVGVAIYMGLNYIFRRPVLVEIMLLARQVIQPSVSF
jgi:teichuronic acid exporter